MAPLHDAARDGDAARVAALLDAGEPIDSFEKQDWKNTALMLAASGGHLDVVNLLLKRGADVHAADSFDKTVLMFAVESQDLEVVEIVVLKGAEIDCVKWNGKTALLHACSLGNVEIVEFLLSHGASTKVSGKDNMTPLYTAVLSGSWDVARYIIVNFGDKESRNKLDYNPPRREEMMTASALSGKWDIVRHFVESGADPDARGHSGRTSLMYAARFGDLEAVEYLVRQGADYYKEWGRWSSLLFASSSNHWEIVRYFMRQPGYSHSKNSRLAALLKYAAKDGQFDIVQDIIANGHLGNADQEVALMSAAAQGHLDLVAYLVGVDVQIDSRNHQGKTPLMFAAAEGKLEVVRFLVDAGAPIDSEANNGWTALLFSAARGHWHVVRYLVERGAEVNIRKQVTKTALIFAVRSGSVDDIELLLNVKADINGADANGWTPLMHSAERGSTQIVSLLLARDADVLATSLDGSDAVKIATIRGNWGIVQLLIGAKFDASRDRNYYWELMLRSAASNAKDVTKFIAHKLDEECMNVMGKNSLMQAAESRQLSIVQHLSEFSDKVCAVDKRGRTPLIYAAIGGDIEVVRCVANSGANVNAADEDGITALMYASMAGAASVVAFLVVECSADVTMATPDGQTAISLAGSRGHNEIQHLLLRYMSLPHKRTDSQHITLIYRRLKGCFISPFQIELQNTGSSGEYRAKWLDAGVVVKLFVPGASPATFLEEVVMWHQLRHPNIIKLYGACDLGHSYFVLEDCKNGPITKYLSMLSHNNPQHLAWKLLHDAAMGLAFLHERGIRHGSLRGSSILLGDDGVAKISELGLSGSVRDQTASAVSSNYGPKRWQSPEVLDGGEGTLKSDIYSFGLCIIEVITGEVPWYGMSDQYCRTPKMSWDPSADPDSCAPGTLIGTVRALVARMCCRNANQRITAAEAVQLIGELVESNIEASSAKTCPELKSQRKIPIDEYEHGELVREWGNLQSLVQQSRIANNQLENHVFEDLESLYGLLRQSHHTHEVFQEASKLVKEFSKAVRSSATQTRIHALSSTRITSFSIDMFCRRVHSMRFRLDPTHTQQRSERELQWNEMRTNLLEVFVSEISQQMLIMRDLKSEEDRIAFMTLLKAELESNTHRYTSNQLAVMQRVHDDMEQDGKSDLLETAPPWFLPVTELVIDKWLGSGSFGDVYLAKWLESHVVIKKAKVLDDNVWSSTGASSTQSKSCTTADDFQARKLIRRMFERELEVWFGLSHPHVVRLFGACHIGTPFFACEYASHGSLDTYLGRNHIKLIEKLHEAALGVQYLHSRGIVHGDLKCNNIVIGSDEKAKVTDFGLSCEAALTGENPLTGAAHWLAPECFEHGASALSYASDVYAFGMCIVEALRIVHGHINKLDVNKHPPYPWNGLMSSIVKHYVHKQKKLPPRPELCSDSLWDLVCRMSAYNPDERIKISTVVDELAHLAAQDHDNSASKKTRESDSELQPIESIVEVMKDCCTRMHQRFRSDSTAVLSKVYDLLWNRIRHLSPRVGAKLTQFVNQVKSHTRDLENYEDSFTQYSETALRGYALHRALDKLMEANFWSFEEEVHQWMPACRKLLERSGLPNEEVK